jgi:hypothetical protein
MCVLLTVIWKEELAGSVVIAELQKQTDSETEEMFRKQIQFYGVIIGIFMCVS